MDDARENPPDVRGDPEFELRLEQLDRWVPDDDTGDAGREGGYAAGVCCDCGTTRSDGSCTLGVCGEDSYCEARPGGDEAGAEYAGDSFFDSANCGEVYNDGQ